ncbi:Thioredoxin reductase [Lactiplantibacillus plajomi]
MTNQFDVIVVGAGPGGMTAALYASRANLNVAILDRGIYGGQMNNTAEVENYPGFENVLGPDLAEQMFKSATQFGVTYQYGNVARVLVDEQGWKHLFTDNEELVARAVIIATGSQPRKLGIPGEEAYGGRYWWGQFRH